MIHRENRALLLMAIALVIAIGWAVVKQFAVFANW